MLEWLACGAIVSCQSPLEQQWDGSLPRKASTRSRNTVDVTKGQKDARTKEVEKKQKLLTLFRQCDQMWECRRRGCCHRYCQVLAWCSQPFCGLPEHNPISMTSQKCILVAGATHSKCQVSCCRCNKPVACQLAALPRERCRAFGRQLWSISVRSDISVPKHGCCCSGQ